MRRRGSGVWTDLSRRQFLKGLAATTGALALGGCGGDGSGAQGDPELAALPMPESSGFEHVVVVTMENRSFDHFLGWLPGADGMQAGLEYTDKQGNAQQTFHLAPEFQGCQYQDPDHSYDGGRIQYDGGAADGWLRAGSDDLFPIGYYTQDDLAFFGQAVPAWTTFDRYFCGILGPTFPNRFYLHAGQTDRLTNTLSMSSLTMIWDRLAAAGVSGTYYYSDVPIIVLWGSRLNSISKPFDQFLADAAAGTLPNVAYIDPKFLDEAAGTSNDDHPFADIRNGQVLVNQIYEAVTNSPNWADTVLIFTYDEWGGFFDHVPPPLAPQTDLDAELGNDGRLGFRVPCVIVSPLARRGFVAHQQYDHTSILSLIEWRWGLEPLSVRDETANNLAHALDLSGAKNLDAPQFSVPQGPFGQACMPAPAGARIEIADLRALAKLHGFPVP